MGVTVVAVTVAVVTVLAVKCLLLKTLEYITWIIRKVMKRVTENMAKGAKI